MRLTLVIVFILIAFSTVSISSTISVNYPHEAYLGQEIRIQFQFVSNYINSTNFSVIASGVEIVHNGSKVSYTGAPPGGGYLLFPIQTNDSEIAVRFVFFFYHVYYYSNPGIVLYGGNFRPPLPDGDQNDFTSVLLTFNGRLWYHINGSWFNPISSLPYYSSYVNNWINITKPVNYTVIFEEEKGLTLVKCFYINGKEYAINYLTPIPWNFSYVGIRTDTPNVMITPKEFLVTFPSPNQLYVVYLNGKEYTSGYTNNEGQGEISLRVTSTQETLNISWPAMHLYKVITISASDEGNVRVNYPILPISLIAVSIVLTTISAIISLRRK
ncbi:MAG: hypothetical protein MPF33_05715 [Candidatus Aramenus sp.]|jgi:hypothetical protein|nr:hypothetical protein [Candidatus Aramenus sp.]